MIYISCPFCGFQFCFSEDGIPVGTVHRNCPVCKKVVEFEFGQLEVAGVGRAMDMVERCRRDTESEDGG